MIGRVSLLRGPTLVGRRSRDRQDNGVTSRAHSTLHTHGHAGLSRACTRARRLRLTVVLWHHSL